MPKGPRKLFKMMFDNGRSLYEVPASTQRFLDENLPLGGGGYLRHSPYWYSRRMIRRLNATGQPAVVYIHPWEIDPNPPPVAGLSLVQRFRTYGSTAILENKLERLLDEFDFTTMIDHIRLSCGSGLWRRCNQSMRQQVSVQPRPPFFGNNPLTFRYKVRTLQLWELTLRQH
jgi:hypothetical protein